MIDGTIAIIGRPNVGKSTLFNRLIKTRLSIVDDQPGVTRDRLYGKVEWLTKNYRVIDTGGIEMENRPFQESISLQIKRIFNVSTLDNYCAFIASRHFETINDFGCGS